MCPPVLDGQPVSAAITNPSFIDAVVDDSAAGIISFENTDPASGSFVDNIQKESNSAASFMGKILNSSATDVPSYTNNEVGTAGDSLRTRVDALSGKFNGTGGHAHTGAAGDAPAIAAADLASVPLRGFVRQGNNVTTGTGASVVVTSDFSSQTPGGSALQTGVVTDPTFNKVLLRQTAGSESGDIFTDADGNEVYGRLTYAALNWTLSFYVDLAGTETAYSFPVSQVAAIYYQEIFNPMVNPPTYSEFAIIPSDNVTADVVTATTTVQGKVSLATTAQPVGSSSSAGTANASVANENHTHAGVHSVAKSGSSGLLGDVTLSGSGGTTLTQASQNIEISSVALTTATTPSNVAATAAIGSSTESAKADHAHAGVYAVDAGFGNKLGTVAVTSSGGTTLSSTAGGFQIASPSLTASSPAEVAGSAAVGVATDIARSDHAHRGVHSVSKSGSSQLFGDVTLSAGTNITLTQAGQNIEIASTGGGGGATIYFDNGGDGPFTGDVVFNVTGINELVAPDSFGGATVTWSNIFNWAVVANYTTSQVITSSMFLGYFDAVILLNASASSITIQLPAPGLTQQRKYTFKRIDTNTTNNNVLITTPSGTIDGSSAISINKTYMSYTVISDGTNYYII
jgi:hypothetical protein